MENAEERVHLLEHLLASLESESTLLVEVEELRVDLVELICVLALLDAGLQFLPGQFLPPLLLSESVLVTFELELLVVLVDDEVLGSVLNVFGKSEHLLVDLLLLLDYGHVVLCLSQLAVAENLIQLLKRHAPPLLLHTRTPQALCHLIARLFLGMRQLQLWELVLQPRHQLGWQIILLFSDNFQAHKNLNYCRLIKLT